MRGEEAAAEIERRRMKPHNFNLIYLCSAVTYTPAHPARPIAQALGAEPISVMGLIVERFGDRWQRLLAAEVEGQLAGVGTALGQELVSRATSVPCAVICDTEVLYAFPDLNPTALLYSHSSERVIAVSVKASRVARGLRLLEDGPVYAVDNCTVLDIDAESG
jgi:hypothetical protein